MKKIILLAIFILIACNKNADLQSPSTNSSESLNGKQNNEKSLQWSEQATNDMNWKNAVKYCENLNEGGYNDWRLPNIDELRTLIKVPQKISGGKCQISEKAGKLSSEDWSAADCVPVSKSGDKSVFFWSSSVRSDDPDRAWLVGFGNGYVDDSYKYLNYDVRCVRGGNNTANKEISHIKNKPSQTKTLSWSQKAPNYMVWGDAIDYCKKLKEGGHNDWHLPTISELRTLIQNYPPTETGGECKVTDSCLSNSCGNDACAVRDWDPTGKRNKLGDPDWFWSSSIQSDNPQEAWLVGFNGGFVGADFFDNEHAVRCVR